MWANTSPTENIATVTDEAHHAPVAPGALTGLPGPRTRVPGRGQQIAPGEKAGLLRRLRRLRGRVRAIACMVDREADCAEVLREIASVRWALHRISLRLVEREVGECLRLAILDHQPDPALERLFRALDRLTGNRR